MLIRYFAEMNLSPTGRTALGYLPRLLALGKPVRLISAAGMADLSGPWAEHAKLLNTPLESEFVNVVCAVPERWAWYQPMPPAPDGRPIPPTLVELYTRGVRNVLLLVEGVHTRAKGWSGLASALKYQAIVVDEEDAGWWMGLAPSCVVLSQHPRALEIALALD